VPKRKKRSRLDVIHGSHLDDWVLGLILVAIPFSMGMWLVVSTAREWLLTVLPEDQNKYVMFMIGVGLVVVSIWLSKKLRLKRPSV